QSAQVIQEKRIHEIAQYRTLLSDLEQWLASTANTLKSDLHNTSLPAIREQIIQHQLLGQQLELRKDQLSKLADLCQTLQSYPDVQHLAVKLLEHLKLLESSIRDTDITVRTRLDALQESLNTEESKEDIVSSSSLQEQQRVPSIKQETPVVEPDVVDKGFVILSRQEAEHISKEKSLSEKDTSVVTPVGSVPSSPRGEGDDTIASNASPIPDEEVSLPVFETGELLPCMTTLEVGSQTGNSLVEQPNTRKLAPVPELTTKSVGITCHPPVDMEVQTQFSSRTQTPDVVKAVTPKERDMATSPIEVEVKKDKIQVIQRITGDEETIEIATKSDICQNKEPSPPVDSSALVPSEYARSEHEDLLVNVRYKGRPDEPSMETGGAMSELNIIHSTPQSFETVVVDPDETTTEVIVDADGTKRIFVRKVRRTVLSVQQHQTVQHGLTTLTTSSFGPEGTVPVTQSVAFSEVILQGQKNTVAHTRGDGQTAVTTSQSYAGHVAAGVPGGEVTVSEFSSGPQHETLAYHYPPGESASTLLLRGLHPHGQEGDVTITELPQETAYDPAQEGPDLVTTSTSSVHAVVQQVTKRIVRKVRKVIRRVVIVDGKERVTEEVIEEPEEVEITEDGIPRVNIDIRRSEDGVDLATQSEPPFETESVNIPSTLVTEETIMRDVPTEFVLDPDGRPIVFDSGQIRSSGGREPLEYSTPLQIDDPQLTDTVHTTRRRIIRKVVVKNGKESFTEEVIDEPEEVEVTERSNIPLAIDNRIAVPTFSKKHGEDYSVEEPRYDTSDAEYKTTESNIGGIVSPTVHRTRRRIIRKIIIKDGKEHVSKETIDEPEYLGNIDDHQLQQSSQLEPGSVYTENTVDKVIQTFVDKDGQKQVMKEPLEPTSGEKIVPSSVVEVNTQSKLLPSTTDVVEEPTDKDNTMESSRNKSHKKHKPKKTSEGLIKRTGSFSDKDDKEQPTDVIKGASKAQPKDEQSPQQFGDKQIDTSSVTISHTPEEIVKTPEQLLPGENNEPDVKGQFYSKSKKTIVSKPVDRAIDVGDPEEPESLKASEGKQTPVDSSEEMTTSSEYLPVGGITHVTRRKIIKKVIVKDGKEYSTKEVVEEPEEWSGFEGKVPTISHIASHETQTSPDFVNVQTINRRIVRRVVTIVDGKEHVTEE
ncbi:unnamed protein product, partial [Timema podura]|nr:unnamed protein product [Timema podura]